MGGEDGDPNLTPAAENKSNLAAREQYYATVRKPQPSPIHDVNALERIPGEWEWSGEGVGESWRGVGKEWGKNWSGWGRSG